MVSVRLYDTADRLETIDLLCDVHEHYHGVRPDPAIVATHLDGNILDPASPLVIGLAVEAEEAIGFAAIYIVPSLVEPHPATNRQCHLKELFVREAHRGKRAGGCLMQWAARHAVENGCGRMDWPVNAGNPSGLKFYQRLGARQVVDRLSYRLDGEGLQALAR